MIKLGVNIDHVATLRQARGGSEPDPIYAALLAQNAGADNITLHLREDRRHIQDRDLYLLKQVLDIPINFEMAPTAEMLKIAQDVHPAMCCFVPEKREELTTEGGLDVVKNKTAIAKACAELAKAEIQVSLFIEPIAEQIEAAAHCQVPAIEFHTGQYADASTEKKRAECLEQLQKAVAYAKKYGLEVHAGHGLKYHNVAAIASIKDIHSLMIGHSIIAHAVFNGLGTAVREMKHIMQQARGAL